jgi:hypothetical protein
MKLASLISEKKFVFTLKSKHGWYDKEIKANSKEEAEKELKDFLKRTKMKGWTYQLNEDKNSLKAEYEKLKKEPFQSRETLRRMEEIYRELLQKYNYEIDSEIFAKKAKVGKFRKSQRVTNFTRDRR